MTRNPRYLCFLVNLRRLACGTGPTRSRCSFVNASSVHSSYARPSHDWLNFVVSRDRRHAFCLHIIEKWGPDDVGPTMLWGLTIVWQPSGRASINADRCSRRGWLPCSGKEPVMTLSADQYALKAALTIRHSLPFPASDTRRLYTTERLGLAGFPQTTRLAASIH